MLSPFKELFGTISIWGKYYTEVKMHEPNEGGLQKGQWYHISYEQSNHLSGGLLPK